MSSISRLMTVGLVASLAACDGSSSNSNESTVCNGSEQAPERLFLQQLTSDSVIIKWRGEADSVCVGTDPDALLVDVEAQTTAGDHKEALITDLDADTRYYYSVGSASATPEAAGQDFKTAPAAGELGADGSVVIWLVGDSGTATEGSEEPVEGGAEGETEFVPDHPGEAAAVRDGFLTYAAANELELDLFVMLGDNAYEVGADANYQGAVFDLYTQVLSGVPVWPTIGNHEMGMGDLVISPTFTYTGPGLSSDSDPGTYDDGDDSTEDAGMPYLDIFTLPTNAEVGGIASGTEQYYSFDYANVHVVSLDTQLTARDDEQRATMRTWLIDDLSSNSSDWTVVIFHHPPYSKGKNHDSDDGEDSGRDRPQFDVRVEFTEIFEDYGVDVVYSGHSHSYERSYYLVGHTGTSDTFDANVHAELDGEGQPSLGNGANTYAQISAGSGADDKVVYTVNGASGKADNDGTLDHPAHRAFEEDIDNGYHSNGLAILGSVVIEATDVELTASYIDVDGAVLDAFTITR